MNTYYLNNPLTKAMQRNGLIPFPLRSKSQRGKMILATFNWVVKVLQTELKMGEIVKRHNDKTTKNGHTFRNM